MGRKGRGFFRKSSKATGCCIVGDSPLEPDRSKIALAYLVELAKRWNFAFIDCQIPSEHLIRLGAVRIKRDRFLDELAETQQHLGMPGNWQEHEPLLDDITW